MCSRFNFGINFRLIIPHFLKKGSKHCNFHTYINAFTVQTRVKYIGTYCIYLNNIFHKVSINLRRHSFYISLLLVVTKLRYLLGVSRQTSRLKIFHIAGVCHVPNKNKNRGKGNKKLKQNM
jgi:hypothetical protein